MVSTQSQHAEGESFSSARDSREPCKSDVQDIANTLQDCWIECGCCGEKWMRNVGKGP